MKQDFLDEKQWLMILSQTRNLLEAREEKPANKENLAKAVKNLANRENLANLAKNLINAEPENAEPDKYFKTILLFLKENNKISAANAGNRTPDNCLEGNYDATSPRTLATIVGFEPTRAKHNRFQVCLLNHSDILSIFPRNN